MKALSLWDLLSPILLIGIIAQCEALTPLETCQVVENASFIGNPSDCQGWYYCLNGVPIAGKCNTGLLYNSYTGSCDYPANVVCAANLTTMCQGLNAVYKRDPSNCQNYCYCTSGVTECEACPTGQVFDLATTSCIWDSDDVLCESDSPCLLAQNTFIKNPNSCAGWYRCLNGEIVSDGTCATGLYYDAFNGMCNYEDKVECNVVTEAPTTTTPEPISGVTECTADKETFIADPKSCQGYYLSVKNGSETDCITRWGQCPDGSQFDPNTQTCTNPYNVWEACKENRCEGMPNSFMAVPGCKTYVICTNGQQSSKDYSCPTGYGYFNEKIQACVTDDPKLPICGTDPNDSK